MVGGIVVEVVKLPERIWVNCVDKHERRSDRCAIYVERNEHSENIKAGDSFWWQGGSAMWTPYESPRKKCGKDYDIRIPRIGSSGVARPR